MKKFITSLIVVFGLMNIALSVNMAVALDAEEIAIGCEKSENIFNPLCQLQVVGEDNNLPDFYASGQHPDAPANYLASGAGTATSPVYFAIDLIRFAVSTIAIVVIFVYALRMIGETAEDELNKNKTGLTWGLGGLILIQLATVIVKQMFFGEYGEAFEDSAASEEFAQSTVSQIRGLIGFAQIFLGAVAVLVIIVRGITVLGSAGDEEALDKAKKHIGYALAGLVVIGLSELVFRGILFPEAGNELPSLKRAQSVLRMLTNFASGFVATLSFVALFYAGYRYVASAGSEEETEKVKKIFIGAIIGLVLAMGAFAFASSLTSLDSQQSEEVPELSL